MPDSPDLIPDSEPSNSTAAFAKDTGSSEEDLASVPSTVHVGSLVSSGREGYRYCYRNTVRNSRSYGVKTCKT